MSFTLESNVLPNPATSTRNGQVVNAYLGSRFSPVNVAPATNGAAPGGGADYGPYTTDTNGSGYFSFAVSVATTYIYSYSDPADTSNGGSFNTYWVGPLNVTPSTNQQGWTAVLPNAAFAAGQTTIAAGSNGAALPQTSISVASTASFAASGYAIIGLVDLSSYTYVKYTGRSGGNTLTGCTGGSGTLATGMGVYGGNLNGLYRRLVMATFQLLRASITDQAYAYPLAMLNGVITPMSPIGWTNVGGSLSLEAYFGITFPVDPNGIYGAEIALTGSATFGGANSTWADF
jgi:hypothetical protein